MSGSHQNMLTLSELYFTDRNGNYRFQWSNQAYIFDRPQPVQSDYDFSGDENEIDQYYIDLARYDLVQKHLNDGSQNAASYKIYIHDKEDNGRLVYTQTLSGFSVDVALDEGEYFWEVEAFDAQGNLITSSGRAYIRTWCGSDDDIDVLDEDLNRSDCSARFDVSDNWISTDNARMVKVRSKAEDKDFYILMCGPNDPEQAWNDAVNGNYMLSTARTDCDHEASGNCLAATSGIYEYENGQWNYKAFVNLRFEVSSDPMSENDCFFTDGSYESNKVLYPDANKLFKWDTEQNKIVEVLTASSEIYYFSDKYYNTKDGVFSIADNSLVLDYKIQYGECPVYDDLFFNVFAKNSAGVAQEELDEGEKGSIVVKYFFFDEANNKITEKEMTVFSGTTWGNFDSEDIFDERIGNCITYILEDDNDAWKNHRKTAIVHQIGKDGSITEHRFDFNADDPCFIEEDNQLVLKYRKNGGYVTKTFGIELDFERLFTVSNSQAMHDVSFSGLTGNNFVAEYSRDGFASILHIETEDKALDVYGMPAGEYSLRLSGNGGNTWERNCTISVGAAAGAQKFVSDADGNMDIFFAKADGIWSCDYAAAHHGFVDVWQGTCESVSLDGKNKIADVFTGSGDTNVLVLTDDANGDALFLEDLYTSFGKDAGRLSQINEIRAGAGDDIIDMTSQKFAYNGSEMTIRGGAGNDVIWAAGEDNDLFGDAGDDHIIGSAGFDVIAGGAGNDTMATGGGDDIFVFCENFGNDTVEITVPADITLWFASGVEANWDAAKRIYSDGNNTVTVIGGAGSKINVKFDTAGEEYEDLLSVGAFESASSEKIFENIANVTPAPEPSGIQYFGTVIFPEDEDKEYSDKEFDDLVKAQAVVSPLKTSDGDDVAISNAGTCSYFEQGIDFGAGNDRLVVSEADSGFDRAGAGVWINGDINFGSGNNTLEVRSCNVYADNLYFGDGDNTVTAVDSDIEIGVKVYDSYGDEDGFASGSGNVVFGNGNNTVYLADEALLEANNITFGNGNNTVSVQDGSCLSCDGETYGRITFGSGTDLLHISGSSFDEEDNEYESSEVDICELNMGDGDDTIVIGDSGMLIVDIWKGGIVFMGDGDDTLTIEEGGYADVNLALDMGNGDDTLVLDGVLRIGTQDVLKNIENISGCGTLIIDDWASEEFISEIENTGITVSKNF